MSNPFDGAVLRQVKTGRSNHPSTSSGEVVVFDQDTNGSGTADRDEYINTHASPSPSGETQYLVHPDGTSSLAVADSKKTEEATAINDAETIFQFNETGFDLIDSSVSVSPTPQQVDIDAGIIEYDTSPGQTPTVEYKKKRLHINWTKNTSDVDRFGWNAKNERWDPLPGKAPSEIGELPKDGLMELEVVEAAGDPRITVASPSSSKGDHIPTSKVGETTFENQYKGKPGNVQPGEAVVNKASGKIQFASDVIDQYEKSPVFEFRYNFFSFEESTGKVGEIGSDPIVLNPIPTDPVSGRNLHPRIRVGTRTYLDVNPKPQKTGNEDAVWDPNTGELEINVQFDEGEGVYYDGVWWNRDPVSPFGSTKLGTINPHFRDTKNISRIDLDTYPKGRFFLYVRETGEVIDNYDEVKENKIQFPLFSINSKGFNPSYQLVDDKAQFWVDSNNNAEIQLSHSFEQDNDGRDLMVGMGAFYLEDGISFFLEPSARTDFQPDAQSFSRISDQTIEESIPRGPFFKLDQTPIQDISGYGQNTFFKVQDGIIQEIQQPGRDLTYEFEEDRLNWAEKVEETHLIVQPKTTFNLPDSAIIGDDYSFELDQGSGFKKLKEGEDILLDKGAGSLDFINEKGSILFEGTCNINGDELTSTGVDFSFPTAPSNQDKLDRPLVVLPSQKRVFRVVEWVNKDKLKLHESASSPISSARFELREGTEAVFLHGFEQKDLSRRSVRPWLIRSLDPSSPGHAPSGDKLNFLVDGSQRDHRFLNRQELGQPVDDQGNQNTLKIPAYFRNSNARFDLLRDQFEMTDVSPSSPSNADEYSVDLSSGVITFHQSLYDNFPGAVISFKPSLSQNRSTGDIEVLGRDRSIGVPDDVSNASELKIEILLFEDQYSLQAESSIIFFNQGMKSGDQMRVVYTDASDGSTVDEKIGFRTREDLSVTANQSTYSFAQNEEVDPDRSVRLLENGSRPIIDDYTISLATKEVQFGPDMPVERRWTVDFHVRSALGGEQQISLLNTPQSGDVVLEADKQTQTLPGDQTSELQAGMVLLADRQSFQVNSVSYTGSETEIDIQPKPRREMRNPDLWGTSGSIGTQSLSQLTMAENRTGDQKIHLFDPSGPPDIPEDHILFIDGDPYPIDQSDVDEERGLTEVGLRTELAKEYVQPALTISDEPVYPPESEVLNSDEMIMGHRDFELVKFDQSDTGRLMEKDKEYSLRDSGEVFLDTSRIDTPRAGEVWLLAYTAREVIEPTGLSSSTLSPRLKASYTHHVNANDENGLLGSKLKATYTFRSPDSFFFRVSPLKDIAGEVSDQLSEESTSSGQGPFVQGQSQAIHDRGIRTDKHIIRNLIDEDRVARRFIEFYNDIATALEDYLQILDGRVIGDHRGRFKFFRAADGNRGGENPVTGELIPYYTNPDGSGTKPTSGEIDSMDLSDQWGYIRNSIDDRILVSKSPYDIEFDPSQPGISFEYEGTFKQMWEDHRFSRLYPEQKDVFTITIPDSDWKVTKNKNERDGNYTFIPDFNNMMADLGEDDVFSVQEVHTRSPRAWLKTGDPLISGGSAAFGAGVKWDLEDREAKNPGSNDQNLKDGRVDRFLPGFSSGQIAHLGRVNLTPNPDGTVDREVFIYAQNMKVSSVTNETITLERHGSPGQFDVATDPATLDGTSSPASNYDAALDTPKKGDTVFTTSKQYFKQGIDYGVDNSSGELVNKPLPEFITKLLNLNQNTPSPKTFLEVNIRYANQETEPFRFPALDGKPIDDAGDNRAPYVYPLKDSEIRSFARETSDLNTLHTQTTSDILRTQATLQNQHRLDVGVDLSNNKNFPAQPNPYNHILIEGSTDGSGNSKRFHFASAGGSGEVSIAAHRPSDRRPWVEQSAINVTVDNLFQGTGTRDSTNDQIWHDDGNHDFTVFSGADSITLHISGSSYSVNTLNQGSVEVASSISETSGSYRLSMTDGGGEVKSDLTGLHVSGVDFTWAQGQFDINSGLNADTYQVDFGQNEVLYPQPVDPSEFLPGDDLTISLMRESRILSSAGSRDSNNDQRWNDQSVDFRDYSGLHDLFIVIFEPDSNNRVQQIDLYRVQSVHDGHVITESQISSAWSSTHDYALCDANTWTRGHGAVDRTKNKKRLYLSYDPTNTGHASPGHYVTIHSSSLNGGIYQIENIGTGSNGLTYFKLDRELRENEGTVGSSRANSQFPIRWHSYNPRRFSSELQTTMRRRWFERHSLYIDNANSDDSSIHGTSQSIKDLLMNHGYKPSNPSVPAIQRLHEARQALMNRQVDASDGDIDPNTGNPNTVYLKTGSGGTDLTDVQTTNGSGTADWVVLEQTGPAQGYYRIKEIADSSENKLLLKTPEDNFGYNFAQKASSATDQDFEVWRGNIFGSRTYALVLYEIIVVRQIIDRLDRGIESTFHDPLALDSSDSLITSYGDPDDSALELHQTGSYSDLTVGVNDRETWITSGHPVTGGQKLKEEIQAILKGREKIYDLRFGWIDYRTNKREGSIKRLRNQEDVLEEEKKRRKQKKQIQSEGENIF